MHVTGAVKTSDLLDDRRRMQAAEKLGQPMTASPRIAVLVKQIPQPSELALVDGRLVRSGVLLETNAYCRRANARAVELAGVDGEVVVFTMGAPQAESVLREMIACGASRGVLVTDPALAGSDTLITSRVLAEAIRHEGPFDAIFTGAYTLDSETGHVGIQIAQLLGFPFVGPCRELDLHGRELVGSVEIEGGYRPVQVALPAVAAAAERLCAPSKATGPEISAVPDHLITRLSAADLGFNADTVGLAGSPTRVGAVFERAADERLRLRVDSAEEAVELMLRGGAFAARAQSEELPHVAPQSSTAGIWCVLDPNSAEPTSHVLRASAWAARATGRPLTVVAWPGCTEAAQSGDRVLEYAGADAAEDWAEPLGCKLAAERPHAVLSDASVWGRELLARIAARLGWGMVGDAVQLSTDDDRIVAWKAAFSGQAMVPISSVSPTLLATVRPGAGPIAADTARDEEAVIERVRTDAVSRVIYGEIRGRDHAGYEISRAERLVIVGTGVEPAEYDQLNALCDVLDAGPLGCTRKVSDAGWLPRSRQIGITGRSVAPRLVVSVGASGKFNHASGFRSAGFVVAINSDPAAPVLQQADIGIVGDWHDVVPALVRALEASRDVSGNARGLAPVAQI